ncbi:Gibberellin 20 oxidase 3 [Sesamum angolense]|uniref:Gibberellin 20 oxidase 3 n=1 Tax=Sesamum angolense TaxID=2727404 RepID=A0AAE1WDK5_9LAMI|nr:Gibberellin 20 oxidase 3 [Sesamum angolense]
MDSSNASLHHLSFFELSTNFVSEKFVWPREENHNANQEDDLNEPIVDLEGFFNGEKDEARQTAELVRSACLSHDRFCLKLPWKETISCCFHESGPDDPQAAHVFFRSAFGQEFEHIGWIFQEYCKAMKRLSVGIIEILGMSLGVDESHLKEYFQEGSSIMRCNFYPPCQEPGLALGTGPHCDPTALAILHQDQVGGLQVFADHKWKSVRPRHDALVALTNGVYKSCGHRAVVNKWKERVSLVYFLCPREDKIIVPPENLEAVIALVRKASRGIAEVTERDGPDANVVVFDNYPEINDCPKHCINAPSTVNFRSKFLRAVELLTGQKASRFRKSEEESSLAVFLLNVLRKNRLRTCLRNVLAHEGNPE